MTPVYYNGNDYYKKMLELQRRLRRSEEERIRLEERFSLLEHESRSRHETCINRLRMRYIEFLEEQQARDERNHKLLGALDRVDSSLALISAKTDRLGTMRRQYEAASLFKNWYVNRRVNGSVAGDSGVASQNNDVHLPGSRLQDRVSITKHNNPFISAVNPNPATGSVRNLGSANYSPSAQPPDPRYDFRRSSSTRQETSQLLPYTSSLCSPPKKSETNANPKYFPNNRPETVSQSFQQSPQKYRYDYPRFNYNALESLQSPLRSPNESPLGYSRDHATRRASLLQKDLSKKSSPVYSGFLNADLSPPRSPSRFPIDISNQDYGNDEDVYRVGDIVENELERYMRRIPKLYRDRPQTPEEFDLEQNTSGDLLNVTFSDDGLDFSGEERTRDGRTSPAEFGHVLSSPKPEIEKIGRRKLPNVCQNLSVVESGNSREAGLKATGEGREILANRRDELKLRNRDLPITSDDQLRQLTSISSLSNPHDICDKSRLPTNEKISTLAKNGISLEVARNGDESGTRPSRNNEDIARDGENSNREINANTTETRQMGREARLGSNVESEEGKDDAVSLRNSSEKPENFDGKKQRVFNGEEREAGNNFQEYAEDLEPWNPSALEKRVQGSMITKNDSQFDSIQRESDQEANDERWAGQESEINVSGTNDEAGQVQKEEIEKYAPGVDDRSDENVEIGVNHGKDSSGGQTGDISDLRSQDEVSKQRFQGYNESEANPIAADQLIGGSAQNPNKVGDPNLEFGGSTGVEETYANQENMTYSQENYGQDQMQYEYPVDAQYQDSANVEQYQQEYDPQNNAQYEGDTSGGEQYQYQVDDQGQYQGYNVGEQNSEQGYAVPESNAQYSADNNEQYVTDGDKQYVNDTNAQYVTDDNAQYVTDDNAQYVTDANAQYGTDANAQYVTDTNAQYVTDDNAQYVTDANAQYVTDANAQYVTDTNAQYATDTKEQYVTDSNAQYAIDANAQYAADTKEQYVTDTNAQYATDTKEQNVTDTNAQYANDTNEQYVADPNQQYVTDPNEAYITDPNQQYVTDPNEAYVTDPSQQYVTDPNEPYVTDTNEPYVTDTNEPYVTDTNEPYVTDPNEPYGTDPTQQYVTDPNEPYVTDPTQQYVTDPNEPYVTNPNEPYVTDPTQQYAADPNQEYLGDAQQYPESEAYVQDANQDQGPDKSAAQDDQSEKKLLSGDESISIGDTNALKKEEITVKKTKDVIKSLLDSDTESTIERNVSNAESDFDFN